MADPLIDRPQSLTLLSLSQAAEVLAISKSTISRAVHSGKLSASRDVSGRYQIAPSELMRYRDHVLQRRCNALQNVATQPPAERVAGGVAQPVAEPLQNRSKGGCATPDATPSKVYSDGELIRLETQVQHLQARVNELEIDRQRLLQDIDDWKEQAKCSTRLLEDKRVKKPGLFARFFA